MNSIGRIRAAVGFAAADRVPVVPAVFGHAAVLAGVPLGDYLRDGERLARCQLQALKHYGYDAVFAFMDLAVETEACGSRLSYHEHQYPDVASYVLVPDGDPGGLVVPDPERSGRMPEVLRAAAILRREVGDDTLVVGGVAGPMTLATQLIGMEAALYLAADDPDRFERLLDFASEAVIRYGCAQIAAGVHLPLVFEPSGSSVIVPPRFFAGLVLPRLRRVLAAFKEAGALFNWVMITGAIDPILPHCTQMGSDILHLDYDVDLTGAIKALPRTCVAGNVRPLAFVTSTPEAIIAEAQAVCALFAERGGLLLSSGCEIPPEASGANIAALVAAVRPRG